MLRLFTDSDTDMYPALAEKYGYTIIAMPYSIDGVNYYPYKDSSDDIDFHAFYEKLRNGLIPSTSALNPAEYREYFEPVFKNGDDILYIHCSSGITGTFAHMRTCLNELLEEYPDRKFYSADTLGASVLCMNILIEAGEKIKNGATAQEVVDWVESEKYHFACYFYADDLTFFARSGRVSGFTAAIGNILGMHPIIAMTRDGKLTNIGKERGKQKTLKRILKYVDDLQDDIKNHKVIIGHSDAPEIVSEVTAMLKEKYGDDLDISAVCVNPTIGSHCGPSCMGIAFHSKDR